MQVVQDDIPNRCRKWNQLHEMWLGENRRIASCQTPQSRAWTRSGNIEEVTGTAWEFKSSITYNAPTDILELGVGDEERRSFLLSIHKLTYSITQRHSGDHCEEQLSENLSLIPIAGKFLAVVSRRQSVYFTSTQSHVARFIHPWPWFTIVFDAKPFCIFLAKQKWQIYISQRVRHHDLDH